MIMAGLREELTTETQRTQRKPQRKRESEKACLILLFLRGFLCVLCDSVVQTQRSILVLHRIVVPSLFLSLPVFGLAPPQEAKAPTDNLVVTRHDAGKLKYTATAGTLVLKEEDGKALASMFFVAYTLNGVEDLAKRPITFTFNGGP